MTKIRLIDNIYAQTCIFRLKVRIMYIINKCFKSRSLASLIVVFVWTYLATEHRNEVMEFDPLIYIPRLHRDVDNSRT